MWCNKFVVSTNSFLLHTPSFLQFRTQIRHWKAYERNKSIAWTSKQRGTMRHVYFPMLAIFQASKSSTSSSFPYMFHHFSTCFVIFHGFPTVFSWLHWKNTEASSISQAASRGWRAPLFWARAKAASNSRRTSRRITCLWWCPLDGLMGMGWRSQRKIPTFNEMAQFYGDSMVIMGIGRNMADFMG